MKTDSDAKALPSIWRILLIVMVLFGVFFRLVFLDGKVFWVDEAFTALRISGYTEAEVVQDWIEQPLTTVAELMRYQFPLGDRPLSGTIQGLASYEPQLPPLYFVLTRWWVQAVGPSIAAIRSLGAIASLLTLPLMALLSRELFPNRVTAYLAVCLIAVSPFQVIYAQEARPYSVWTLFTVAASWALLRAMRRRGWMDWGLYALSVALSLYTFVYTIFVMAAHLAYGLWDRRSHPGTLRPLILSQALAVVAFSPWLVAIARNWQSGLQLASWQRQPLPQRFLVLPLSWLTHISRMVVDFDPTFGYDLNRLFPYLLVVLSASAAILYSVLHLSRTAPASARRFLLPLLSIPAICVLLPDLILGTQQSIASRYFVPCWVGLILTLAYGFSCWLPRRLAAYSLTGLLTLSIFSCGTSAIALSWWNKEGGYIPYVAYDINRVENALIYSPSDWWLFSLAHELTSETPLQITTRVDASLPPAPGFSYYFLYGAPPPLQESLQQQGFQLARFDQLDQVPLWCLFPPDQPPTACPPKE